MKEEKAPKNLLAKIQEQLKAPKNQYNSFSGFYYRSCEDILEAVKPLLDGGTLTLGDEPVLVGDRVYIKATATLVNGKDKWTISAYAREAIAKKGMDEAQITGACSSYARKYALNGLFLIDDTKDPDSKDNKENGAIAHPTTKNPTTGQTEASKLKSGHPFHTLDEVKLLLVAKGAKNSKQALEMLGESYGIFWEDFSHHTQDEIDTAWEAISETK